MMHPSADGAYYELTDPVSLPKASGFLWNETMMIQATCRGYATARFMQPEPSKYSYPPNVEAKTFMLPEQSYYLHHPGRFVYVKDEEDRDFFFSAPYEPVRRNPEHFAFQVWKHKLVWLVECGGIEVAMSLCLPKHDPLELWRIKVKNLSGRKRSLSLYPYFTVGFMSWMNQSGEYHAKLGAIVCSCVTPYQKSEDYAKIKEYKDKTFLWAQSPPISWETSLTRFEGEGGLPSPSAIAGPYLSSGDCRYETPAAVMQYRLDMDDGDERKFQFMFGPAKDENEILSLIRRYGGNFDAAEREYADYIAQGNGVLRISTPDAGLDTFVNNWLPRQVYYHGITNRMCTDPQTRNYIQDGMGMSYIMPQMARDMFLFALGRQQENGEMPDGILLHPQAELKYINQIPHSDHCVWLPISLAAYLDETGDYALLDKEVPFEGGGEIASVSRHIDLAMDWLINGRDERGLNYIRQGDWCDPMNMVGYKGKGVSGWLTMAGAYALRCWAAICRESGRQSAEKRYQAKADEMNAAINRWLWDGDWYARGITDDGVLFGVSTNSEGQIFLNAQSWAILCGAAGVKETQTLMQSVEKHLETPYGVEIMAPSYTAVREDIGRLTQKHPGTAENGSVYNHAAVFYIYALYITGENDGAFRLLRKMLPGESDEDIIRRGQMPVFIPNYYRGAYSQFPRTAGRSSHLFNTGTVSWYYRCLIDGLFGLRGTKTGLSVHPRLPSHWKEASVTRYFRGAEIHVDIRREAGVRETTVQYEGKSLVEGVLTDIIAGKKYQLSVKLPLLGSFSTRSKE
jgi:cellobionic acid phosphorylase